MKPTVRNIADMAGVSTASVSLVLNNKPSRITTATKQKILKAAEELGYDFKIKQRKEANDPNELDDPIIGVIRPRYNNEFLDACQCGIDRYAYVYGYKVITCNVDDSTVLTLDYIHALARLGVMGIILIPPVDMNENKNNEKLGDALKSAGIPYLLLDQAIDRVYCDFITTDNKGGAYMAAEYLIHNGHREIGMIAGKRDVYTCRKRIEGYKEALAFYNISIKDENIYYGNYRWQTGYKGMKYLEKLGVRTVFAYDDEIAIGVYKYAQEKGLKIGEDISVVGFNDSSIATILTPGLTSVNQPGELMGKKACEVLIKRITGEDKDAVRTTYFGPRLTERCSVKNVGNIDD